MINQTEKVSTYCTWAGLTISQPKTLATAALYHRSPANPFDHQLTSRLLANIQMQGKPVQAHDPKHPYKLLGVWFTMDLNLEKQQADIKSSLKTMGLHLGRCYHTQTQKLRTPTRNMIR
jgi:hypothetical protein